MFITRRDALFGSAALALASTTQRDAAAQALPQRLPLHQFVQIPAQVDALRRGVRVMKERPPSDPRSWFFQAAVHGVTDEAVAEAQGRDTRVASVDREKFWNQCPHFGQPSGNFLFWHRAYLHYFEAILRDAAGEPNLMLPYWQYDDPGQRGFPRIFAPEFLDQAETRENALHHPDRELAFVNGLFLLSAPTVDPSRAMALDGYFGGGANPAFAGGFDTGTRQGLIETAPHNLIHFAVGGVIGSTGGSMASVRTAAFDPIFWVHHANIDRFWAEWSCTAGKDWGVLPPLGWFDERPWFFHDAAGTVRNEPRRRYADHRGLGYTYPTIPDNAVPLAVPTEVAGGPAVATTAPPPAELARSGPPLTASANQAATLVLRDPRLAAPGAAAAAARRKVLEFSGLRVEGTPSSGFMVFVNRAADSAPDQDSPAFVGMLALFGLEHGHHRVDRFDATRAVSANPLAGELRVEIIPFDLMTARAGRAPLRRNDSVSVERIRLIEQ